jgi:hypothetical protein
MPLMTLMIHQERDGESSGTATLIVPLMSLMPLMPLMLLMPLMPLMTLRREMERAVALQPSIHPVCHHLIPALCEGYRE